MIVIGVDVGGTSIKGASITEQGKILDRFSMPMDKKASPNRTFGDLAKLINEFIKEHRYEEKISGIGLGVPGLINKYDGTVASSPNMKKWLNFNIVSFMEKKTKLPVKIINDASAAALGEAKFGKGRDYEYMIMITLGTGVGGGIVYNGKVIDGNQGVGAQLGHGLVKLGGRKCGCGRKGCLEAYASATALIKETNKALKKNPNTLMHKIAEELGEVDARVAFAAEKKGDSEAIRIVNEYVMYLGEGLINIFNMLRPEIIVLSGGVANEGEYLINKLNGYVEKEHYGIKNSPKVIIEQAGLGYDAGKVGAAALFFE